MTDSGWRKRQIADEIHSNKGKRMKRPLEQDYTSLAAYTRALEEYCDGLAQRTWVGLTDQEIWTLLQFRGYNPDTVEIAKAIEAKLKELNHD